MSSAVALHGQHDGPAADVVEAAQNADANAVIHDCDLQPPVGIFGRALWAELVRLLRAHHFDEVNVTVIGVVFDALERFGGGLFGGDRPHHHADVAELAGEGSRINARDAHHAMTQ